MPVPLLQISEIMTGTVSLPERRVEVRWQDGTLRHSAKVRLGHSSGEWDTEQIRWYLEDYPEFTADPAPALAAAAEARLKQTGEELFCQVFRDPGAARIWKLARDRLAEVRVEVMTEPGDGPDLPWELLRDPEGELAVALSAGAFVRIPARVAIPPVLPKSAGDTLRVLLVICRPGGQDDVPFRSVASRLIRGGAEQMPGLQLDVLRPATFARLSAVLKAACAAGLPYNAVHFDGHGTWLDLADLGFKPAGNNEGGNSDMPPLNRRVSVAGPVRPGWHGYLLFENPASQDNLQLVDGPTLAHLLTATKVPVLILNACRSAYSEERNQIWETGVSADGNAEIGSDGEGGKLAENVQARIRAYRSLAAEVTEAGVPGVVAMRYNVSVMTAAQFTADLYAHLLAGQSLGQSVVAGRRALASNPTRLISPKPVVLQDWSIPVVYEAVPLLLLDPEERTIPLITLTAADTAGFRESTPGSLPGLPAAGFIGRDEALLALDRAFDTQPLVLLHGMAGVGKSATAAEFARWYKVTGGLNDSTDSQGAVLWLSSDHRYMVTQVIDAIGDFCAKLIEAKGALWHAAITNPQRRELILQFLKQIPLLLVWDDIDLVPGFPAGTQSAWGAGEQDALAALFRDLAWRTRCKILIISRRPEHPWLGCHPARVQLGAMSKHESLQLAVALAVDHDGGSLGRPWWPLLDYAAGNPLTITVLAGRVLRENLVTTVEIQSFIRRFKEGHTPLEADKDTALGRPRSLAASLGYGFGQAFTNSERPQLALLHLFRGTVDVEALWQIGDPDTAEEDAVSELTGLTSDTGRALLDRAADLGIMAPIGGGQYQIHPVLSRFLAPLYMATYGRAGDPAAERATLAYVRAIGARGSHYHARALVGYEAQTGHESQLLVALRAEEANLRHALTLASSNGLWETATACLSALRVLYTRTGRNDEWGRLVSDATPDFIDPATGGPLPGREEWWNIVAEFRVRLAMEARDWASAKTIQEAITAWDRERAAEALTASRGGITAGQWGCVRNLSVSVAFLGNILYLQGDPACLRYFQEAFALCQRIGYAYGQAEAAIFMGGAFVEVPRLRDLNQAERWARRSLRLVSDSDHRTKAKTAMLLADIALERVRDALAADQNGPALPQQLNAALRVILQALDLLAADDHQQLARIENKIGIIYSALTDPAQAIRHYQQAIQHSEAYGNIYGAGLERYNAALLLASRDQVGDALHYAHAALTNIQQARPGAAELPRVEELIVSLERRISES